MSMTSGETIHSMTGFARGDGGDNSLHWTWEIKSVNGKGLDVRFRLPSGMDDLESLLRDRLLASFKRGNINVSLTVKELQGRAGHRINEGLLDMLTAEAKRLCAADPSLGSPTLDGLLAVRGVVEEVQDDESEEERAARNEAMLADADVVIADLRSARAREGNNLGGVLSEFLDEIAACCDAAGREAELQPGQIRETLAARIAELLEQQPGLPEERLAQEAAVLMTKADIREELDRLQAHLAQARELMAEGGVIGRKLDFLCQEFNREANTICSKAATVELSRIGLKLKSVIEQLREQVQNIE